MCIRDSPSTRLKNVLRGSSMITIQRNSQIWVFAEFSGRRTRRILLDSICISFATCQIETFRGHRKTRSRAEVQWNLCVARIYTKKSIKGLYKDSLVSILGSLLYRRLYFGLWDFNKDYYFQKSTGKHSGEVLVGADDHFLHICYLPHGYNQQENALQRLKGEVILELLIAQ
eukprot:TRINITY_DN23350_c0_g1_i2.p2 TRINITY_DN23350_c0_g1~~TRINITY_DN23350_c0_g1_i2.p2  ORF type:complete len:172 (-),score=5.83 TRINITY_DN23350_c0_g1_i2:240-755(-)